MQPANHPRRQPQNGPHPNRSRQAAQQRAFDDRPGVDRQVGRIAPRPADDRVVLVSFLAEKAEDRGDARTAQISLADADRRQPVLVEFDPRGYELVDRRCRLAASTRPIFGSDI